MLQYNKTAVLTVNDRTFHTRIKFSIEKNRFGSDPSKIKISVYNLSAESRNQIESSKNFSQTLYLSAGYDGVNKLIYAGQIYYAHSERVGADILTHFRAYMDISVRSAIVQFSGLKNDWEIFQECMSVLKGKGIAQGAVSAGAKADLQGGLYPRGVSDSSTAGRILDRITSRHNLKWNTDNGALNLHKEGEYTYGDEVFISQYTGMVGIPTKADSGNHIVKCLLNPDIVPGKKVKIKSITVKDAIEIDVVKVTHEGDTHDGPFESTVEGIQLGSKLMLNAGLE